jgi:hypothetical protein
VLSCGIAVFRFLVDGMQGWLDASRQEVGKNARAIVAAIAEQLACGRTGRSITAPSWSLVWLAVSSRRTSRPFSSQTA